MSFLKHQWKTLSVSLVDTILTISMNRPKVNAMSPELLNELIQAFNQASNDHQVKGVLLRSNLKLFFSFSKNFISKFPFLVRHLVLVLIFPQSTIYRPLVNNQLLINMFSMHLVMV